MLHIEIQYSSQAGIAFLTIACEITDEGMKRVNEIIHCVFDVSRYDKYDIVLSIL